jgi:hypothetical protein
MNEAEDHPVRETPRTDEGFWFALCITFGVAGLAAVVAAAFFVLSATGQPEEAVQRAQMVSPFLVAIGAIVTFCTIAWRGAITTRQVNSDAEQGLAQLLEKGIERLKPRTDLDSTSLAAAMLETVALAPNSKYAEFALERLAFGLMDVADNTEERLVDAERVRDQIERIFVRAKKIKRSISLPLRFEPGRVPATAQAYRVTENLIPNSIFDEMPRGVYTGRIFRVSDKTGLIHGGSRTHWFSRCVFVGERYFMSESPLELQSDWSVDDCAFISFEVRVVVGDPRFPTKMEFQTCNFSDAILGESVLARIHFEDCFYIEGHPPFVQSDAGTWEKFSESEKAKSLGLRFEKSGHMTIFNSPAKEHPSLPRLK